MHIYKYNIINILKILCSKNKSIHRKSILISFNQRFYHKNYKYMRYIPLKFIGSRIVTINFILLLCQ